MQKKSIALAAVLVTSIAVNNASVFASGYKFKAAPIPSHQENVIESITPNTITIEIRIVSHKGKIEEKKSRAFGISKFTEIIVNGRKGTIADLKHGMHANVTAGTDRTVAARIDANG